MNNQDQPVVSTDTFRSEEEVWTGPYRPVPWDCARLSEAQRKFVCELQELLDFYAFVADPGTCDGEHLLPTMLASSEPPGIVTFTTVAPLRAWPADARWVAYGDGAELPELNYSFKLSRWVPAEPLRISQLWLFDRQDFDDILEGYFEQRVFTPWTTQPATVEHVLEMAGICAHGVHAVQPTGAKLSEAALNFEDLPRLANVFFSDADEPDGYVTPARLNDSPDAWDAQREDRFGFLRRSKGAV